MTGRTTTDAGQRSRTRTLAISAGLLLALIAVAMLPLSAPAERPFDLDSASPQGLAGLRLWLAELGYHTEEIDGASFAIPQATDLIFVFPNQTPYTEPEAALLRDWVEAGGTLALVAAEDAALAEAFGVDEGDFGVGATITQMQPLLPEQPATADRYDSGGAISPKDGGAAVPVLALDGETVTLAVQQVGQGVVWHLGGYHLLTNEQLRDELHAAIVVALLRTTPTEGTIAFDTSHLFGPQAANQAITTLQDWLYRTALGWATLFALVVGGLFWLLQGRRLGPPLATARELRRREAAEYVHAMANLQRRAHVDEMVAAHHKRRLKIGLGRALHVNPELADDDFLRQLANADQAMEGPTQQRIARALSALDGARDERTLVAAVAAVDGLLNKGRAPADQSIYI